MFNVGGGELIVILLIALIVLGPQRLPDAARQVGKAMADLRRLSTGFQNEVRSALDTADDPTRVAARRNPLAQEASAEPSAEPTAGPTPEPTEPSHPVRTEPLVAGPPMEPRNEAASTPTRPSAQERAAARKSPTLNAEPTEQAPPAGNPTATNGTPVQKATAEASTAEPADEASTGPTTT